MPKSILVVDDEPVVVEITKRKLQESGYEVMIAGDGEEAFVQLNKKMPDIIILDIQMPKMNGYSFIMEKSKSAKFVDIPVIVLTAYNEMEPLFKRHGIKAYLLKPLKMNELLEKVAEVAGPAV